MKEKVLELFNKKGYKPLNIDDIFSALSLSSSEDFTGLAKVLNHLVDENIIMYNSKNEFALLSYYNMASGIIDVKDAGYAFVDIESGGVFIPSQALKGAITYDEVMIKYKFDKKKRLEGEVVRILKRNVKEIVGILTSYKGKNIVKPIDSKIHVLVYVKTQDLQKALTNDIVKVQITKYYQNNTCDGKVVEIVGNRYIAGNDITGMVLSSGIQTSFSKEVIDEVSVFSDDVCIDEELRKNPNLVDLTKQRIITIDGIDAKDLDDAVSVKKLENGDYLLGVYIADVSNYVKEDTFLDIDAFNRGTSVYLPDRVIPMLPKKLSNGICSLNEGKNRLVMACEMTISPFGKVESYNIFEGYIKSTHRMNYDDVNEILMNDNEEIIAKYIDIYDMLKDMEDLASILYEMRIARGAFEFESIEPKLILNDDGKVERIDLRTSKVAEGIIEEFMLIANETIAKAMTWLDVPFIYRVHEEPNEEKITKLLLTLDSFGYKVKIKNKKSLAKALQKVLLDMEDSSNTKIEKTKNAVISKMMIRSMAKAKYQESNIGHFGLASECYTHFTSPIRRYPDLLVHRLIKQFLLNIDQVNVENPVSYFRKKVNETGSASSSAERKAEMLERNATEYKIAEYMKNYIGKTFSGIVSAITNFGMYVTLDNTAEGLVSYKQMHDDYYDIDEIKGCVRGERHKKCYYIGDRLKVKVMDVDLDKRLIEFKLLGKDNNHEN